MSKKTKIISPNNWYAILGVAMVLVLLGFFVMLLIQSKVLVNNLKEQVNIILELKDGRTAEDIASLQSKLEESVFVKSGTIKYLDKAAALESLKEDFGADFLQMDFINPLHDVFIFNAKAEYLAPEMLKMVRSKIMDNIHVRDVYYEENLVDAIAKNLYKLAWTGIIIAVFFLLVAIFLIHNTMRLALHSNRFLIKNMELVGANWSFISKPFIQKSIWNGFLGAMVALLLLLLLFTILKSQIPQLDFLSDIPSMLGLSLLIVVLGIVISGSSTYYVVRKYLLMRLDDLY